LKEYQAMRRARLAELVTRKIEQRKGRGRDEDSTLITLTTAAVALCILVA
jgi:hypothetical protein